VAGTTRLELATSAVTAEATSCNFTAPIAILGALGNCSEVLLHPNCTQIFIRSIVSHEGRVTEYGVGAARSAAEVRRGLDIAVGGRSGRQVWLRLPLFWDYRNFG
jgi:hypothetical protein